MQTQCHASSNLLDPDENEYLHRIIGTKAECMSMAVVQLFCTKSPAHTQWFKQDAGVLCLIKDNIRRAFTLRMFNMDTYNIIFEEDLYEFMEYIQDTNFFHSFQTHERIIAFNFANHYEASIMYHGVTEKLKYLRNQFSKRLNTDEVKSATSREHNGTSFQSTAMTMTTSSTSSHLNSQKLTIKKSAKRQTKITKDEIGMPSNFIHTMHYGIDMEKNFTLQDCPADLKNLLQTVNISDKELQNPRVRETIRQTLDEHIMPAKAFDLDREIEREDKYITQYRTKKRNYSPPRSPNPPHSHNNANPILQQQTNNHRQSQQRQELSVPQEQNGIRRNSTSGEIGLQIAVDPNELFSAINNRRRSKEDPRNNKTANRPAAKLPKRQPTIKQEDRPLAIPPRKDSKLTVAPPGRSVTLPKLSLPATMVGRPLPPVPAEGKRLQPSASKHANSASSGRPRTPAASSKLPKITPAPPPLPPMSSVPAPPPPPPPPPAFPAEDNFGGPADSPDGKSALFDAIRKGKSLKPPDLNQTAAVSPGMGAPRNDLLSEIRKGRQLNPVQARNPNIEKDSVSTGPLGNDLAAALSRALKIRSVAIQSEESEDESEVSEAEWEA